MSEKWEVVSRAKKEKVVANGKSKPTIDEKKKFLENAPKPTNKGAFEETPNFFKSLEKEDDKRMKKEAQAAKAAAAKKAAPPTKKPNEKKSPEAVKVKAPKTLEQALAMININDVQQTYDTNAGGPNISRLLDVARFLNSKVTVDQNDEIYSEKSLDYPLSVVPSALKTSLEKIIRDDKNANTQVFLELCLSSIANNMIKGVPASGYKLIVQLIASINSKCFVQCASKVSNLLSSYQNRPPIGLSLLWAVGQGGVKDFNVGVQVWKEIMAPMVDMRHYVKYTVNYLVNLLRTHISSDDNKQTSMKSEEFFIIYDFIHAKRKGMPKDLELILNTQSTVLRKYYFEKSDAWKKFDIFEQLMDRLPNTYAEKKQKFDLKSKETIVCFLECLRKKNTNYKAWKDVQKKQAAQTSHIFKYIETNYSALVSTLNKKLLLDSVLNSKTVYQDIVKGKKKDEGAQEALLTCQNLIKKMAGSRKFPWIFGCILLLPIIASLLLAYDVQISGSFEKSNSGRFLKNVGALEFCQIAWSKSLATSARGYKWAEKNTPHYYSVAVEFSKPYVELTRDMTLVVANQAVQIYGNVRDYAAEKAPLVYSTIDHYVPGFLTTVQGYSKTAWEFVREYQIFCCNQISTYLKTKVFVDNWAPELLHAKTLQALNSTQLYAAQYYNWFYKHVDDYSKIQ